MTNTRNTINNTSTNISIKNNHHQDNYNYNYNNNYTEPGVSREAWTEQEINDIKMSYFDNISDRMTASAAQIIEKAYNAGLTVNEIIMAIEETGLAPNPTPWYLKKILENWAENGVTVSKIRHLIKANEGCAWWK